jgi:hypothetical protein
MDEQISIQSKLFFGGVVESSVASFHLRYNGQTRHLERIGCFQNEQSHSFGMLPEVIGARSYWHGFWAFLLLSMVVVAFLRMPSLTWRMGMVLLFLGAVVSLYLTKSKITLYFALEFEIFMMTLLAVFAARFHFGRPGRLILAAILLCVVVGTAVLAVLPGDRGIGRATRKFVTEQIRDFENPWWRVLFSGTEHGNFQKTLAHGSGLKVTCVSTPTSAPPDYNLYEINHVTVFSHNIFLDVLSDTGILGFVTFLSFLGFLYWKCTARLWRSHDLETRITLICVLGAMTGFLIANLTCPNGRWPIGAGNMWAVLGLMAGMINRRASEEESSETPQWRPTTLQTQLVYGMLTLSLVGFGITSTNSFAFFKGSMIHNEGLSILGNPPENPGPLAQYLDDIASLQRESRKPGLTPAQQAKIEQDMKYYLQQFAQERDKAIEYFRKAIELNPTFLTSYYKLASILSMGNGLQVTKSDLEAALGTYKQMQEYSAEFSQTRYNLGMLYYRLLSIERMERSRAKTDPKFDAKAAQDRIRDLLRNAI